MFKKMLLLTLGVFFIASMSVSADCGEDHGKQIKAEMKGMKTEVVGTMVCVDCSLKGEGARAECKVNGCNHAIKTEDGKFISLMKNKYSTDLLSNEAYSKKKVTVAGTYFANANVLDVESFSVDGKKKSWCDHCSAMDGCMAKK